MRNHPNENEFDLHENERASENYFHMNGFARRLVLRQGQKVTRKWPIVFVSQLLLEIKLDIFYNYISGVQMVMWAHDANYAIDLSHLWLVALMGSVSRSTMSAAKNKSVH